jgi:hypothetical protein
MRHDDLVRMLVALHVVLLCVGCRRLRRRRVAVQRLEEAGEEARHGGQAAA